MKIVTDKFYKNKDWLYQKYIVEKKDMKIVAEEAGCSEPTICRWIHRCNIDARNETHHGYYLDLSRQGKEYLTGLLLGDGSLTRNNKHSLYYEHTDKNKEYLLYLSDILESFGFKILRKAKYNKNDLPFKMKILGPYREKGALVIKTMGGTSDFFRYILSENHVIPKCYDYKFQRNVL